MLYINGESEVRMALRHVRQGQDCISRQLALIARLREKGISTDIAETVLLRMEEIQHEFERYYLHIRGKMTAQLEGARAAKAMRITTGAEAKQNENKPGPYNRPS